MAMTYTLVKLPHAGESLTMLCEAAFKVTQGQWPEDEFQGRDGKGAVAVRVPEKSAERQLTRLGLALGECPGLTLTISRGANKEVPSKPYWNIDQMVDQGIGSPTAPQPAPVATKAAPKAAQPTDDRKARRDALLAQYVHVMGIMAEQMRKIAGVSHPAGIHVNVVPLDMGHVQAATFSVFKMMRDDNLLPVPSAKPVPTPDPEPWYAGAAENRVTEDDDLPF